MALMKCEVWVALPLPVTIAWELNLALMHLHVTYHCNIPIDKWEDPKLLAVFFLPSLP